jgi:hypothetical protein
MISNLRTPAQKAVLEGIQTDECELCCTVVVLLLHCCYAVLTLLLHCCYTVVTLLLHCSYTVLTLLLRNYYAIFTQVLPQLRRPCWKGSKRPSATTYRGFLVSAVRLLDSVPEV